MAQYAQTRATFLIDPETGKCRLLLDCRYEHEAAQATLTNAVDAFPVYLCVIAKGLWRCAVRFGETFTALCPISAPTFAGSAVQPVLQIILTADGATELAVREVVISHAAAELIAESARGIRDPGGMPRQFVPRDAFYSAVLSERCADRPRQLQ